MTFIYGGKYQGKLAYAKGLVEKPITVDETDDTLLIGNANIINNFDLIIKEFIDNGVDIYKFIDMNLENFKDKVIIGNEIGLGVVPIKKEERKLRDEVGFAYQILVEKSNTVIKIWNGLPIILKTLWGDIMPQNAVLNAWFF